MSFNYKPFCSWCLGAEEENLIPFSVHHFPKVSDLNSVPLSDLRWVIVLIILVAVGMFEVNNSIPSIQASLVLSCIPMSLKILENLSHRIKNELYLDSIDNPRGSGFGTVSTWISSRGYLASVVLGSLLILLE